MAVLGSSADIPTMGIDQPSVMQESRLREGERGFLGSRRIHEGFDPIQLQFLSFGQGKWLLRYNRWPVWGDLFSRRRGLGRCQKTSGGLWGAICYLKGMGMSRLWISGSGGSWVVWLQAGRLRLVPTVEVARVFLCRDIGGVRGPPDIALKERQWMTERGGEMGGFLVKYLAATGENKGLRQEIEALEKKHGEGQGKSWGFVIGGRNKGDIIGREKRGLVGKEPKVAFFMGRDNESSTGANLKRSN
ncbi:hypothetical protein BS47DRAFT_1365136 [Hydnum rufescens UP504]|uniref:Uncharacterized protein n=1 Tax=Hydnum rufescens UP504 TaxID=1448309 RepID=A0A9P6DSN4_9AGAM|nr:hypothetical protein BS47DRAFT_1365136 [Hydnum rufescens UP504]